jgi:hypothetical protein
MAGFDELAEKMGNNQWEKWKKHVLDAKKEIQLLFVSRLFLILDSKAPCLVNTLPNHRNSC